MLVLPQSTLEDRLGRVVALQVVPLAVRTASAPAETTDDARLLEIVRVLNATRVDVEVVHARDSHEQFWSVRLARERAIATTLADGGDGAFQPGLFDRRAEQALNLRRSSSTTRRIALLEWTVLLDATRTHVALVLSP